MEKSMVGSEIGSGESQGQVDCILSFTLKMLIYFEVITLVKG